MSGHKTSVIVPTLATDERSNVIKRAIESIVQQQDIKCIPIIIANGTKYDPDLLSALSKDARLRFHYLEQGSLPDAIGYGRRLVDTEYFCFLDDDDVLLGNSVAIRLNRFSREDTVDVVVGNGYVSSESKKDLAFPNTEETICELESDPLNALFKVNWLGSCSGLYKTDSIDISYFNEWLLYFEWTYMAFRLAFEKKIGFVGEPTYKIYNTSDSLSKSDRYLEGQIDLVKKVKKLDYKNSKNRELFEDFFCKRYHSLSMHYLSRSKYNEAFKYHIMSLRNYHGLKYMSYSRHILMGCIKALLGSDKYITI